VTVPAIPRVEHAHRRSRVLSALRNAIGVVFAGEADPSLHSPWRPHPHFEYLTGIADEPGAILLLDPLHPVAARRTMLFLKPLNPELEQWDGLRDTLGSALRDRYGIATIFRTLGFARWLNEAAQRARRFACLHPIAPYTAPISPDLELFKRVAERLPGAAIEDRSQLLATLRAVKSGAERACIQMAIDITGAGFDAVMRSLAPGQNEFEVQTLIEHNYRLHGAKSLAFRTIAGGGINSTVLHYHANDQPLRAGDLLCVDSGAAIGGYSADITRTLPVSGRFTPRQREVYEVVLAAQRAAIKAARAGVTLMAIDAAARKVIEGAGLADGFIHGIGHHLGLETHDASPDAPLAADAVITIEPGVYLPQEGFGIRIEDDVLVGRRSASVLSSLIPKSADEIEGIMKTMANRGGRTRDVSRHRGAMARGAVAVGRGVQAASSAAKARRSAAARRVSPK
jgi:Xaa-Pro aminopeptidase